MYCDKCGRELENDAVFCDYCGERISREYQVATKEIVDKTELKQEDKPKSKSKKKFETISALILISICIGLLIFLVVGIFVKTNEAYFKELFFNETYSLSFMDNESGNITENGFWISESKDRLLIFKRMVTLEQDIQYGMYLYGSGSKKYFTEWSIESDKTLTLCFDTIYDEVNGYQYSKTINNDTWYYDKSRSELRIGLIVYHSISESEVKTTESENGFYDLVKIAGIVVEDENGYRY